MNALSSSKRPFRSVVTGVLSRNDQQLFDFAWQCVKHVRIISMTPELDQKTEQLLEAETDLNLLVSRLRETEGELAGLQRFCGVLLPEPALSLRRAYCARKLSELNATDAQLRAQIQVLEGNIRELQIDIQRLQVNPH